MKKTLGIVRRGLTDLFWVALTGAVLFGGYTGFQALKANRSVVEVAPVDRPIGVVDTIAAEAWGAPLPVRAEGFVKPLRSVPLAPLSGGKISYLHPSIIEERGRFSEGEVLVRLDDATERANLLQTEANISGARAQLTLERASLERIQTLFDRGAASAKALDEVKNRFADITARLDGLLAAKAATEVAIQNKVVRAPFDGAILSRTAEVGSVVGAGQAVATGFTDDHLVVDVNLSETEASLIPGLFEGAAAAAELRLTFAGRTYLADGRIKNVAPAFDPRTRTLATTIELADGGTLRAEKSAGSPSGIPPALINSFFRVEIAGLVAPDIYKVPTTAIHAGNVWLLVGDALRIVPATVVHVDGAHSFAEVQSVPSGARFVVSTIVAPVEGMPLRDLSATDRAPLDLAQDTEE